MIPQQWTPPCGSQCTHKYAALTQIPWRVFCKKGCDADSDSWEDCVSDCSEICYKDPVLKDRQWSAYIDRSPGAASYSEECFHACVAGCGYKFEVESEEVDKVKPKRPPPPPPKPQPPHELKDQCNHLVKMFLERLLDIIVNSTNFFKLLSFFGNLT